MGETLRAPFPYFGGKRRVAELVWSRLGNPRNYIEPFAGSLAVLLARPDAPGVETVNDVDCYLANFWRATSASAAAVAHYCDWPVNEADLHARHRWLVLSEDAVEFRRRMREEPEFFDARVAGWWCWGLCMWIGGGWCNASWDGNGYVEGRTALGDVEERRPSITHSPNGVHAKRPALGDANGGAGTKGVVGREPKLWNGRGNAAGNLRGVLATSRLPDISGANGAANGRGVLGKVYMPAQIPMLRGGTGCGVCSGRPQLADDSASACDQRREWLMGWFGALRDRLRAVRVCCGDWQRVCNSPSVTTRIGLTGVFLDPPYPAHDQDGKPSRCGRLYASDSAGGEELDRIRDRVLAWCRERCGDPMMRIAVCGYDTDGYAALEAEGWTVEAWKTQGGYGARNEDNGNNERERIWFSPHCLSAVGMKAGTLFAGSSSGSGSGSGESGGGGGEGGEG